MVPGLAATVIISTYNRPGFLTLTLEGFLRQTTRDFEIVVADDGSGDETGRVIDAFAGRAPFPVRRVWQEDEGYRLARIRNLAAVEARSTCLIFNDDDCIPFRDLVERYVEVSAPGRFWLGRAVYLDEEATSRLDPAAVREGLHEGLASPAERRRLLRARLKNAFYIWYGRKPNRPVIRGNSFAVHRDDLMAINGFDEAYKGWGQEDDDLARRLRAAGPEPRSRIGVARVAHQYHGRPAWTPAEYRLGSNLAYQRRGVFLARCLLGIERRDVRDLSYCFPAPRDPAGTRLRDALRGEGLSLSDTGPAEVEIRWRGEQEPPEGFDAASQVRVLAVPGGSEVRARSTRDAHLVLPVGSADNGSDFLARLADALSASRAGANGSAKGVPSRPVAQA